MHDNNMGNSTLEREKKRRLWVVENGVQRHLFFSFFFLVEIFTIKFCCCKNLKIHEEREKKKKGAPREGRRMTLCDGLFDATRPTMDARAGVRSFSVLFFFPAR